MFLPELQQRFNCGFASLIENTVQDIHKKGLQSIGILASPTTIRTGLYEKPFRAIGIKVFKPNKIQLTEIELAIRNVIAGADLREPRLVLRQIQSEMMTDGAEAMLLGCTELSVLFPEKEKNIFDPLHIIASVLMDSRK